MNAFIGERTIHLIEDMHIKQAEQNKTETTLRQQVKVPLWPKIVFMARAEINK